MSVGGMWILPPIVLSSLRYWLLRVQIYIYSQSSFQNINSSQWLLQYTSSVLLVSMTFSIQHGKTVDKGHHNPGIHIAKCVTVTVAAKFWPILCSVYIWYIYIGGC